MTAPAKWMTHAAHEEMDPVSEQYARTAENTKRLRYRDSHGGSLDGWEPTRQFPCSGTYVEAPDQGNATTRLFVCDVCGAEIGVPPTADEGDHVATWIKNRANLPQLHVEREVDEDAKQPPDVVRAITAFSDFRAAWANDTMIRPPLLVGEIGVGKTQMLVRAALDMIDQFKIRTTYWTIVDLLKAEKAAFGGGDTSPIEKAKLVELLILDDLGAERDTDFNLDAFGEIIDARYREGRPIFAATNLPPSEWPAAFGDRPASRLLEMTQPLPLGGTDRRMDI